jgi:hypothetical protein
MVNHTQQNTIAVLTPELRPAKDIAAPAYTKTATLKLRAATCSLLSDNSLLGTAKELNIVYNDTLLHAHKIELPLTVEPGNITVVMMAIEYTVLKNGIEHVVKDKRWMPAAVVGAIWS